MSPSDIPWIAYVVLVAIFWRPCVRAFRHHIVEKYPSLPVDWDDVVFCLLFGFFATLFWPLWILPVAWWRAHRRRLRTPEDVLRAFGGETRRERLRRQEQHIAELERELQIR